MQMAKVWEIVDNIIGTCFDTTASNTVTRQGAAILIESQLKRAILYLACRHHQCELHIKHAFTALRGKRDRPDEPLFETFQSDYSSFGIDYSIESSCVYSSGQKTNYVRSGFKQSPC